MQRREVALGYIANHNVITLATVGPDGPWAAAVFYVNDQFDFYFLSAEHTHHAKNFQHTPQVAATIQEDYSDWSVIKGVQLEGVVEQLDNVSRETVIERYVSKYPYVATSPQLQPALRRVNWYRLRAATVYFIDNSLGLGHRDLVYQQ